MAIGIGDPKFVLECGTRAREVAVANRSPESGLDVQQSCRKPSVLPVGVLPVVQPAAPLFGHPVDGLDHVGGLEGSAQQGEHTQPVLGEQFFEAFVEARHLNWANSARIVSRSRFASS